MKAWLIDTIFVWWDFLPPSVRRWAEANDHI